MLKIFASNVSQKSNKRLVINMLANAVAYSSSILISFFLTPYLINTLGKEVYSFYPIANTCVSYMSIIVNAMNSIANRFIAIEIINKNTEKAKKYFTTSFISNLVLCAVFLLPTILIMVFIDKVLTVPINLVASVRVLFALIFSTMMVNIGTSTFGIATYATNRIDLRSYRELITAILRIVLFVVLFATFKPTIIYVGLVALIVACVNFLIQLFYTKNLTPELRIQKNLYSFGFMKEIIPPSIWNIINQLGNIMLSGTILILSNKLYGASAGADYSIVHTIPGLLNGVITMLVGVFMPLIMQYYAKGDIKETIAQTRKAQKIIGIIGCSLLTVFVVFGREFFMLWVPSQNAEYLQVLSVISIIPHFIICSVWPVSNLNVIINKLRMPAFYLLGSGVASIILSYFVSIAFPNDLRGMLIMNSIIQVIWVAFFVPIYPCKYLGVKKTAFYPPLIKTMLGVAVGVVIAVFIKNRFLIDNWFSFFAVALISGVFVLSVQVLIVLDKNTFKEIAIKCLRIKEKRQ